MMAPNIDVVSERGVLLSRQQRSVEARLQELLDAQSEGLLRGLGRPAEPSSSGSEYPDTYFSSKSSLPSTRASWNATSPHRTNRKRIGLNSSRSGIAQALAELITLKTHELEICHSNAEQIVQDLAYVEGLGTRETGLRESIGIIEDENASLQIRKYRQEEEALSKEIVQLENRLWEMQTRRRHLLGEIEGLENRVQSKLSSYKTSLGLVEEEIRGYLARSPETGVLDKIQKGFWALPPPRRTLVLAKEHLHYKQEELKKEERDLKNEETALQEGRTVWQDVVSIVTVVEDLLRQEKQRFPYGQDLANPGVSANNLPLDKLLSALQVAQTQIEPKLGIAEDKGWNLLVLCIGAELEAIIEGYDVLQNVVKSSRRTGVEYPKSHEKIEPNKGHSQMQLPRKSMDLHSQPAAPECDVHEEDDGPGPDLLISTDDSPT